MPAVILFSALPEPEEQLRSGVTAFIVGAPATTVSAVLPGHITGHGRRRKQAHDDCHDRIWIRRGVCRPCGLTFTILPHWSPPYGQYSFHCREQAWEATANKGSAWGAVGGWSEPCR